MRILPDVSWNIALRNTVLLGNSRSLAAADDTVENTNEQREALDMLLRVLTPSRIPATGRINAIDRTWEDWQRRTGELPPKFSALPSQPFFQTL